MATFEPAGDFEDQIREAVADQMETIVVVSTTVT